MERRSLGGSGMEVSPVAIGCWAMGDDPDWWGGADDSESIAAIREAIDRGINLIDTAPAYGNGHSEQVVGEAIRGCRDRVVIATKCGLVAKAHGGGGYDHCLRKESIIRECERSLRLLAVETIDVYQCHWPDPNTPIPETMAALTQLLEQGKIGAIGVSNFSCEQMDQVREHGPLHSAQPPLSMFNRVALGTVIPYCREHEIGVIVYSPLEKGLLTGKYSCDSRFDDLRARSSEFQGRRMELNLAAIEQLRVLAERYGKTMTQLAINWAANQPGVTAAIVGAKRPSQVCEHIGALGWRLDKADLVLIENILAERDRAAALAGSGA